MKNDQVAVISIFSNLEKIKTVKNSFDILNIISEYNELKQPIYPTRIAEVIHEEDLKKYINNKNLYKRKLKNKSDNIGEKCRELKTLGLIDEKEINEQADIRRVYYQLTTTGIFLLKIFSITDIENQYKELKKTTNKSSKEYENDDHSEAIRDIITKIIDEFPIVFDFFISQDPVENYIQEVYSEGKFSFEEDILFDDLEYHMGQFISFEILNKKLDQFKTDARRLPELKNEAMNNIKEMFGETLDLEYDRLCQKTNSFSEKLLNWIYEGNKDLIDTGNEEFYDTHYINHGYEVITSKQETEVKVDGQIILRVSSNDKDSKLHQFDHLLRTVNETDAYRKIHDLINLRNQLKEQRSSLITLHKKEQARAKFNEHCPYR